MKADLEEGLSLKFALGPKMATFTTGIDKRQLYKRTLNFSELIIKKVGDPFIVFFPPVIKLNNLDLK